MPAPGLELFGAIVSGKHHDGVVVDAQLLQGIQNRAKIRVELEQAVGPVTLPRLSLELRARDRWHVHQRMIEIKVERLSRLDAAFHERLGSGKKFAVDVAADIEVELLHGPRLSISLAGFEHVADAVTPGVVPGIGWPERLIPCTRRAVPLIKTAVCRPAPRRLADMPLADAGGGISAGRKNVAHGPLPGHEPTFLAGQSDGVIAGANGIAASHQRRARRRALRLGGEIEQLHSLGCECIDALRVGAPEDATPVAAEFAVAEIVDEEVDDVGRSARSGPRLLLRLRDLEGRVRPKARDRRKRGARCEDVSSVWIAVRCTHDLPQNGFT